MNYNYVKICSEIIKDLSGKQKEIILRRFGLADGKERETLESIGKDFEVCRERIRQIEEAGLEKIKKNLGRYQGIYDSFLKYFKKFGNLKKEALLLADLGGQRQNEVYFLMAISRSFRKVSQNKDFYSFWAIGQNAEQSAKKIVAAIYKRLEESGKPLLIKDLEIPSLSREALVSHLEISKKILKNNQGFYGLNDWPEINPRGVRDKAYLALRQTGKPLHFAEVAKLIEGSHLQTVHNELIKDSRFVLVGRGTYALMEWGYFPGEVKEVILKILKEAKKPLEKGEILSEVLKQRLVKENTILMNLSNKRYFFRDEQGRYKPKTEII